MTDVALCRLTAKQIGNDALSRPKIYNISNAHILNPRVDGTNSKIENLYSARGTQKVVLHENPSQVRLNMNYSAGVTTGELDTDAAAVTAAGSVIGDSPAALTKYWNEVTAATVTDDFCVQLPDSAVDAVHLVVNTASVAVDVFAHGVSATIDNAASSTGKSVPVGESRHFIRETTGATGNWVTATDENNS